MRPCRCTIPPIPAASSGDSVSSLLACRSRGAAEALGVTRQALSELVNENVRVSVDMAIRLSKAFGSTPETWLGMQMAHDLWQARGRVDQIKVKRLAATHA